MARSDLPANGTAETERTASIRAVDELEKSAGHVEIDHEETQEKKSEIDSTQRFSERIKLRHVAPIFFVCTVFLVSVGALLFISPMLVLVNNKEQLTNDLNDGLYAHYIYTNRILGSQLGGSCNEDTIECKFKTLSPMLHERFERYGFRVGGEESSTGRYNNATLRAPGSSRVARDESSLASLRKSNHRTNELIDRVYSARNGMYQDRQFGERLLERFGLKQDNTIGGLTQEEFKNSFNERIARGDQRYVDPNETTASAPGNSRQSQDYIDRNGLGTYSLHSLNEMGEAWPTEIYPHIMSQATTHLSTACALSTYGGLMENSLYRAKKVSATRFAMNYLAVADNIKARAGTTGLNVAVDYMANSLLQSDTAGKNGMNARTYTIPALGDKANVTGELPVLTQISHYAYAMILRLASFPLGDPLTLTAIQTSSLDRSARQLCAEGMTSQQQDVEKNGLCYTPASLPLAIQVAPVAAIAITATKLEIEVGCRLAYPGVIELVKLAITPEVLARTSASHRIMNTMEANRFTADTVGQAAQNIIFAGTGTILGDRAQSLGMRPSNIVSFTEYYAAARMAREEIDATERSLARSTPWDATNPHAFLGSIVTKLAPSATSSQSWSAGVSTLLSALPTSFAATIDASANALYTQPMHFQPLRLSAINSLACGVEGEVNTEIMLDIGCNTRYSMSRDELSLEIDDILNYMTQPHPENAQQSLNDINARDSGSAQAQGDRMKSEASEGANAPYIDEKGKPNRHTEYAKFLEYCVNRQNQWGRVGMAVGAQEEVYVEDELIDGVRISHGNSLLRIKPEVATQPDSYYGYGWGSQSDQDWYTGKKCAENSEMLKYFRGYTMACSVLAGMSAARQCWHDDTVPSYHQDDFYTTNNIIFKSSS